jgi:serine protease Do
MNIKILGLGLAIASYLSLSLVSCSATKEQQTSSTAQAPSVDIDNLPKKKLDRVSAAAAPTPSATQSVSQTTSLTATTGEQDRIGLFERSKDAVVTIKTDGGTGSGFLISKDGLVVTNKHVVKNEEAQVADKVTVVLADGTEIAANVLGVSRHQDLALIRIPKQSRLKFLNLAKPETIKVGQNVYALGSPLGIENVFTAGVLNKIDKSTFDLYHDARINHGNSGGPLLNSRGEVIGVNYRGKTGQADDTTISVAIKIDRVHEVIANYKGKHSNFISIANIDKRTKLVALPTTGKAIAGSFKAGDEADERNIHHRGYMLKGRANHKLTIEMSSKQIDPVLALYFVDAKTNESTEIHANSGVSPQNANAKISIVLPRDGNYVVIAKTFQPQETGNYQIKATLK